MIYELGQKVLIRLDPNEQIRAVQEVWKHQGEEAVICMRKNIAYGKGGLQRGCYYQLEGISSNKGVPFSFTEEQLIPID